MKRLGIGMICAMTAFAGLGEACQVTLSRATHFSGYDGKWCKVQPSVATDGKGLALMTWQMLRLTGSDVFSGEFMAKSTDGGMSFSAGVEQNVLADSWDGKIRTAFYGSVHYSRKNGRWFGLGAVQRYADDHKPLLECVDGRRPTEPLLLTVDAEVGAFTGKSLLKFPFDYIRALPFGQILECENGDLLIPFWYVPSARAKIRSVVVRYRFTEDGLEPVRPGRPIVGDSYPRGVCEPSLARLGGKCYLTLRTDVQGLWAESDDGLSFGTPRVWRWDDGSVLENYNTQQHWLRFSDELYLAYTRKGAENDHVFRHRAPLFMAKFDPVRKCLLRATEQVVVPERGARLGNFCVADNGSDESWLLTAEWMQSWKGYRCEDFGSDNSLWLVKARRRPSDPLALPSYEQEVLATFGTPDEAASASCSAAALPDDARLAFSCRWDDTTPAHLKKGEMMCRAGVRGSFYFTGNDTSGFIGKGGKALMTMGHSIGNHTIHHAFFMERNLNWAFRDIVLNRILLETNLQHSVNSFVAPYGWRQDCVDPGHERLLARCLVASGHILSRDNPQSWTDMGMAEWMPSWRFSADDRHPDRGKFVDGLKKMIGGAESHPLAPCVTFGTHSWCDEDGLARQEQWLKELCLHPDWCQLNDWEYGAYCYQVLHGCIDRIGVDGRTARFRVRRFAPASLGDRIPLSLKFSVPPQSVTAAGAELARGGRGTWTLPHDSDRREIVRFACANGAGETSAFPGLRLVVRPNERQGVLSVRLENGSPETLRRLSFAAAIPPLWSVRRVTESVDELASGAVFERTFALGDRSRADYGYGVAFYPVSVDFDRAGRTSRLWAWQETPRVETPEMAPCRRVRIWEPTSEAMKGIDLETVSNPTAELPKAGEWKRPTLSPDALWCLIYPTKRQEVAKSDDCGKRVRIFVYDFQAAKAGTVQVKVAVKAECGPAKLFANGETLPESAVDCPIPVRQGANRVILRVDGRSRGNYTDAISLAVVGDGLN